MKNAIMQTKHVSRRYDTGNKPFFALMDVSIQAHEGELIVIRGRSGSGKTTLLNLLAGLENPTEGEVFFKGSNLTGMSQSQRDQLRRKEIGMVFQSLALFPFMTAVENVEVSVRLNKLPKGNSAKKSEELLRYVGLEDRLSHHPDEMSGGEQQRIAIARAVVKEPSILLADEPTAMLDSLMSKNVMELFVRLAEEKKICVVMTTHNPAIIRYAHRIYTLENGKVVPNDASE